LDTITFEVLDTQDWVPGLQNNEIDAIEQGQPIHLRSDVMMVRNTPDLVLRHAPDPSNQILTFNGAHGAILADEKLRLAVAKAINRAAIIKAVLFGVTAHPVTLNNHIYLVGQDGYQDNSALVPYDLDTANSELDALGWRRQGAWRYRDGKRLELRFATDNAQTAIEMAEIAQQNLADAGIKVDIQSHPITGYFSDVVDPGQFDVAAFGWIGNAFPLNGLGQVFSYDPNSEQGNYGRIGNTQINDLINQALGSLNPTVTHRIVNEIDRAVWLEGHSLPLYQDPGNYPQRANLANYGAFGLATPDYTTIGFLK
jgi:peptide/nickel transport system substrate-binding protein